MDAAFSGLEAMLTKPRKFGGTAKVDSNCWSWNHGSLYRAISVWRTSRSGKIMFPILDQIIKVNNLKSTWWAVEIQWHTVHGLISSTLDILHQKLFGSRFIEFELWLCARYRGPRAPIFVFKKKEK